MRILNSVHDCVTVVFGKRTGPLFEHDCYVGVFHFNNVFPWLHSKVRLVVRITSTYARVRD